MKKKVVNLNSVATANLNKIVDFVKFCNFTVTIQTQRSHYFKHLPSPKSILSYSCHPSLNIFNTNRETGGGGGKK